MKRFRTSWRTACLLGLAALMVACSSIPLKDRERADRARLEAYASEPQRHFFWYGSFDGWKPVGRNEALLWTTPSKAYLVRVAQPCEDLRFATQIGLRTQMNAMYTRGLDYIKVRGRYCLIDEIRRVDYARLKADLRREREMRQANFVDRPKHSGKPAT